MALQNTCRLHVEAKRNTSSSPNDVEATSGNTTQQQPLPNVVQLSKDDVKTMMNTSVQAAVAKSAIEAYESTRADDDCLNNVTTSSLTAQCM